MQQFSLSSWKYGIWECTGVRSFIVEIDRTISSNVEVYISSVRKRSFFKCIDVIIETKVFVAT